MSKGFNLRIQANRIAWQPYIGKLALNNTRKGLFEPEQFESILSHLPVDLKAPTELAYITGWRFHDEILSR